MTTSTYSHNTDNVVDLFSGKPFSDSHNRRIIRLSPELDGLEMLYANSAHPDKLFSVRILCWGLRADGEVVGMVPWLNDIVPCPDIQDPLNGHWQGYYDASADDLFTEPPLHKVIELETAAEYYACDDDQEPAPTNEIIQELPDTIGTHAVLSGEGARTLVLKEVVSWQLLADGSLYGMLVDDDKVETTPVLPGDKSLYRATKENGFRYYFQHHIANMIKAEDPEAMAAMSILVES
ncbi:MAG: hypothetical protein OIF34_08945 [Porticoccaceae bacterium]|nr:hypothetical protein [Porticoccaceae bacterium]